jgi:hypothetical protein
MKSHTEEAEETENYILHEQFSVSSASSVAV